MIVVLISVLASSSSILDLSVQGVPVQDPFEGPNGLLWSDAIKVTDNDFDDQYSMVRVDGDGMANIVFQQSGADYMWAKVDPPNNVVMHEKRLLTGYIPTQYQVKNESTPQPTEFFDIGPDNDIHVVWTEAGLLDNRYRRFDDTGEPVSPVIPMNQVTDLSRLPYIVVGDNGRAYIAFENEGSAWVQMTYVDDDGFIKAPTLIGRPGENVAYAMGQDGNMHLFYRSLGADVSMYHVKLDKDRRPIVPNGILFPNTSKVANPFSSMPTITVTPDGHVHLLISETTIAPHPIQYIELDATGTKILRSMRLVDGAYNYGDIVGDPDNDVYVFWDDFEDGEVHYIKIVDGVPGEDVTITSTSGKARFPQVTSDRERGDIHLTYVDDSDGDGEIYYRYANSFRLELEVSNLEEAKEVHPGGEEVKMDVTVKNIGELNNTVTISSIVDYHGLKDHGWSFELVERTVDLSPGGSVNLSALLTGPDQTETAEAIDVVISAVPKRSTAKAETIAFSSKLIINHELSLEGPPRMALLGTTTQASLTLSNLGDLRENVSLKVSGGLPGWNLTLSNSHASMAPGGGSLATILGVTIPKMEGANLVAKILVEASTEPFHRANTSLEIILVTSPSYFPMVSMEEGPLQVAPDQVVGSIITVENLGLGMAKLELSPHVIWGNGEWDIELSPSIATIGSKEKMTFDLELRSPSNAEAGPGLELEIWVIDAKTQDRDILRVSVEVVKVGVLLVQGGGEATVLPGQRATFDVIIENNANYAKEMELSVQSLPSGWRWQFGLERSLSSLTVLPYSNRSIELLVVPPVDASVGVVDILGTVEDPGGTHPIDAKVTVLRSYGTVIDSDIPLKKGLLGSQLNFTMEVTNTGTAMENYSLLGGDLPPGASVKFLQEGKLTKNAIVLSKETVKIEVLLEILSSAKGRDFKFWAGVLSESGEIVTLELFVEFRLPDIRIKDVILDDNDLRAGEKRKVLVMLANSGDARADDVLVNTNGHVQRIGLAPGAEGNLTFDVTFEGYDKNLVVVVDPGNDQQERKEDNNVYIQKVRVEGKGGISVPGFGSLTFILSVIVSIFIFFSTKFYL